MSSSRGGGRKGEGDLSLEIITTEDGITKCEKEKMFKSHSSPHLLQHDNIITPATEIFHSCDVVCVALPLCAIGSVHPVSALVFLSEFPSHRRSADQG